jgi:hypothetical protein
VSFSELSALLSPYDIDNNSVYLCMESLVAARRRIFVDFYNISGPHPFTSIDHPVKKDVACKPRGIDA